MSELDNVLYNLSFQKYKYITIHPTALSQLDHIFSVIGNGIEYDPVQGLQYEEYDERRYQNLFSKYDYNFDVVLDKRARFLQEEESNYQQWKDLFPEVPERIKQRMEKSISTYKQEFGVQDKSYYFDAEAIAAEQIAYATDQMADHSRNFISTPYPFSSEYSICFYVKPDHHPIIVELVLATYKAWKIVLDYNLKNGLYLSKEQVESGGGTAYYDSEQFQQECLTTVQSIIDKLES
jgi:hypothetical protein